MKKLNSISALLIILSYLSCQKQEVLIDPTPNYNKIFIETSSSTLPFNEYGQAVFKSKNKFDDDLTKETDFYANGEKIEGNVFIPTSIGEYKVKGVHRDLTSEEIVINVEEALNKKILLEYYTSRNCAWCPWIGLRVDSLNKSKNIIGYAIHAVDELEIEGTEELQNYQFVSSRPAIRVNRGYVRNYAASIRIKKLNDSIRYQLSFQAKAELAIKSNITQNHVNTEIFAKFYGIASDSVFLTFILVEDNIVVQNQSNAFSGANYENCPYNSQPNPIPEYKTHNVVRKYITSSTGNILDVKILNNELETSLGTFEFEIDNSIDIQNAALIAILHYKKDNIESSSVINSQIVKLGQDVNFDE